MRYLRNLGWYMLAISVGLFVSSLWQLKLGSGQADFSFVIIVPFAIGLICARKWAAWGTCILGALFTVLVMSLAVLHAVTDEAGVTVGLGPVVLADPTARQMWMLTLSAVALIGVPMCSVMLKFKELRGGIAQPEN